jgi:hypothetical protein
MILQRDAATKVWGTGAKPGAEVKLSVAKSMLTTGSMTVAKTLASADGSWKATLNVPATASSTLTATDGTSSTKLNDVAFGEVLLCGGQVMRAAVIVPSTI